MADSIFIDPGGSSGGTPGGSDTQVQYNDASAFGGTSFLTVGATGLTGTFVNTGLTVLDTDASHALSIVPGSDLTAARTLTITTGDAARTITLSGDPTLSDWFDQSVKAAASPTFAGLTLTGLTTTRLLFSVSDVITDDAGLFFDAALDRLTVGIGSTGTNVPKILIDGGSGNDGGGRVDFGRNSVFNNVVGYESAVIGGTSNNLALWSLASSVTFYPGNSKKWEIQSTGHLITGSDNAYDIGASGATRPRTGYFGTSLVAPTFQNTTALVTAVDGGLTAAFTANMVGATGGPATAAQNGWMKLTDSSGATVWLPVWK